MPKSAIIIGVGPDRGLGAQLCRRFGALGLRIVVAGRTEADVEAVAADIVLSGGLAEAVVADATNETEVAKLFDVAGNELDLAIYNAGNNTPGTIIDMDAAYFERSWRVGCYGGFLFGREALRRMRINETGTLLFTGASASLRGRAGYGAFNSAKAGLRALAQAMAKEYAKEGIHVGHVIIDGAIDGDKIRSLYPGAANRPDELISIAGIVDAYEFLYRQTQRAWSFELDMRTSREKW